MSIRKWTAIVIAGGALFTVGSCASDVAYYAIDSLADYLPDLLSALLDTTSEAA